MDVVKAIEEKKIQIEIAKKFGVSQTQVSQIKSKKDDIREEWQQSTIKDDRKRKRLGKNSDIEEGLYMWFQQARCKNIPINGPLLMEKSKKIAEEMGKSDFEPNTSWLFRWKNRYNLAYKKAHGESADADIEGAEEWIKDVYPSLVEGWDPSDVHNSDETALFYRALPEGSYAKKGEKVVGGKKMKERLTILLAAKPVMQMGVTS